MTLAWIQYEARRSCERARTVFQATSGGSADASGFKSCRASCVTRIFKYDPNRSHPRLDSLLLTSPPLFLSSLKIVPPFSKLSSTSIQTVGLESIEAGGKMNCFRVPSHGDTSSEAMTCDRMAAQSPHRGKKNIREQTHSGEGKRKK